MEKGKEVVERLRERGRKKEVKWKEYLLLEANTQVRKQVMRKSRKAELAGKRLNKRKFWHRYRKRALKWMKKKRGPEMKMKETRKRT